MFFVVYMEESGAAAMCYVMQVCPNSSTWKRSTRSQMILEQRLPTSPVHCCSKSRSQCHNQRRGIFSLSPMLFRGLQFHSTSSTALGNTFSAFVRWFHP